MTHPFLAFPAHTPNTARRQPALASLLSSSSLWTLSGLALVACSASGQHKTLLPVAFLGRFLAVSGGFGPLFWRWAGVWPQGLHPGRP